jgi:hypothetical protein
MKKLILIISLLLFPFIMLSQEFINDDNFEEKIKGNPFDDDNGRIVIVEFWVKFNKDNAFKEWEKLK